MSYSGIYHYYTGNGLPVENWHTFYESGAFNSSTGIRISTTEILEDWTILCSFEKKTLNEGILFSNFKSGIANSGFVLGLTSTNRVYVESYDEVGPVVFESPSILGNKNGIAVTKVGNSLYVDYFDFNSKTTESNKFEFSDYAFLPSNEGIIGGYSGTPSHFYGKNFSGYINSFLLLNIALRPSETIELFKGFYSDIILGQPVENKQEIFSYGMNGISYLRKIDDFDNTELYLFTGVDNKTNLNKDAYFDRTVGEFFGFENQTQSSGSVYLNGVGQIGSTGYSLEGSFYNKTYSLSGDYIPSGYQFFSNGRYGGEDRLVYDVISGDKYFNSTFSHTGVEQTISVPNGRDLVFFNGIKLVESIDYQYVNGTSIKFPASDSLYDGMTGALFTHPIDGEFILNNYYSGLFNSVFGNKFARNTSLFWLNGVRQNLGETYLEVSNIDLLTGRSVVPELSEAMFLNEDLFWGISEESWVMTSDSTNITTDFTIITV